MISVDTLPDDVILAIFHQYVNDDDHIEKERERAWQSLVHVSRRWRSITFESPHHLKLLLVYTERTPARDTLDVWPALPLVILCNGIEHVDDIIAVLERSDRVCRIHLADLQRLDLEIILATMQQPFPELTDLSLEFANEAVRFVPDSFLGGSAPCLQTLTLVDIPFPGLPKLLQSATHLVTLHLYDIPHSGYFSPEALVTALSTLISFEELTLVFQSPRSCPDQASRRPPPSARSVLSVLTRLTFQGVSEYLEDLVTRIDAPRLNLLRIIFFNDIVFDTPRFMQFITRTSTSRALGNAHITLWDDSSTNVRFSPRTSGDLEINVGVLCRGLEWQLSSLEQVCTSCLPLPPLSMLEDLYIYDYPRLH